MGIALAATRDLARRHSVLGSIIKGLFWLVIVGAILFLATAAYGWGKTKLGGGPKSISR